MHRADHEVKPDEVCTPDDAENNRTPESSNESFHGLLWGEFDEWSATEGNPPDVCENIVANNQRSRYPEPDQAFQNIIHDEMAVLMIRLTLRLYITLPTWKPQLAVDSYEPSRTGQIVALGSPA